MYDQRIDHVVRNCCECSRPITGGPGGPHRFEDLAASEPPVKFGVCGHGQVARDESPTEGAGISQVGRRAHEYPGDDLDVRVLDGLDAASDIVGSDPVEDRAVGFRPGQAQHLAT
jgi:hypothetical protein